MFLLKVTPKDASRGGFMGRGRCGGGFGMGYGSYAGGYGVSTIRSKLKELRQRRPGSCKFRQLAEYLVIQSKCWQEGVEIEF